MCCSDTNELLDKLNPTFLFAWKGKRTMDEKCYHSHDHVELAFILSGHGKYHIDGNYYEVQEGDLLVLNAGCKHQAILTDPDNITTEFFVGFSDIQLPCCPPNHLLLPEELFPNGDTSSPIIHTSGVLRQKLFRLCTSIDAENSACQYGRYAMLKTYLQQMLILLLRGKSEPVPIQTGCAFESTNKKYLVDQIVSYLEDHYNEKISLDQIAENMYLSPFYISRIFKSETGSTPIHHLINIRLEKAKELLETDFHGSIQEIAALVGYDDAYHFSKLFKKSYGISPSKFRKAQ